jgi:hypothetical protein
LLRQGADPLANHCRTLVVASRGGVCPSWKNSSSMESK